MNDNEGGGWLRVFPNPANDWLIIQLADPTHAAGRSVSEITLIDVLGKEMLVSCIPFMSMTQKNCNLPFTIDLSGVKSGIYLLRIFSDDKIFMLKVTKE